MKTPRNLNGTTLAQHLIAHFDYRQVHQTGSHIILRTNVPTGHTLAIPAHKPLKTGTLNAILRDIATHRAIAKADLLRTI